MPTDIIIPYNDRSTQKHLELHMCLRSIEKHLNGVGNIFIIGHMPEGFINLIHIPCEDDPRNRFRDRNICSKIIAACKDRRVSDNFLMVHDDHFMLEDFEASEFPYYQCGPLVPGQGQYAHTKENTISVLGECNNYDTHSPILFNKEKFMRSVALADWSKWYGYCLKTLYCVLNGIEGEYYEDMKIRLPLKYEQIIEQISGRKWFSIGDRCFVDNGMKKVLEDLYSKPSKYEICPEKQSK
jgi:hypothetical protein